MHGPDDLARQEGIGRRHKLEGREGDGDGKRDLAAEPVAPAGRQALDDLDLSRFADASKAVRRSRRYFRMPASL